MKELSSISNEIVMHFTSRYGDGCEKNKIKLNLMFDLLYIHLLLNSTSSMENKNR